MIAKELKPALLAIHEGGKPKDVAKEFGITAAKAFQLQSELDRAYEMGTIAEILSPEEILGMQHPVVMNGEAKTIAGELLDVDPRDAANLAKQLEDTAKLLNTRLRSEISRTESLNDLHLCAETLEILQKSFFGKDSSYIQINTHQNSGGTEPAKQGYDEFLGD